MVDESQKLGGYIYAMAHSTVRTEKIWNNALRAMIKTGADPGSVAVELAIGSERLVGGGKFMTRALFHEIGHTVLLKNPKIMRSFLEEYTSFIGKRINQLEKGVPEQLQNLAAKLISYRIRGIDKIAKEIGKSSSVMTRNYEKIINQVHKLSKTEKRKFIKAVDLDMFRRTHNTLKQASEKLGDVRYSMLSWAKHDNYELFRTLAKGIRQDLGVKRKIGGIYYINPEEAFAQLFHKQVHKTGRETAKGSKLMKKISSKGGAGAPNNKNFPKTIERLDPLIKKEITAILKEVILRECRYLLG